MTDDFLSIDLRVLVLKYGRKRVVEKLAELSDQTIEGLERDLRMAEERKRGQKRPLSSASEIVDRFCAEKPDCAQLLRTLANRYDNRTFLPEVRDVKRFLDRQGSKKRVHSRREAGRAVLTALSRLSFEELTTLLESLAPRTDSDYAQLARQIIGQK